MGRTLAVTSEGTDVGGRRALRSAVESAFRAANQAQARSQLRQLVATAAPFLSVLTRAIQARLRAQPPRTVVQDRVVGDAVLNAVRHLLGQGHRAADTWVAEHEQVLVPLAQSLSTALQSNVVFVGRAPDLERPGDYAQYHLSKPALHSILERWASSVRWEPKIPIAPSSSARGFHRTTRYRRALSAPLRDYLAQCSGPIGGLVLYHGVGRDAVGATALEQLGPVTRYDPFHPDPAVRQRPAARFLEVHSHYTLNVVSREEGRLILREIEEWLLPNGRLVVTVRRDLDRRARRQNPPR